jgi:hypothetical protein
VPLAERVVPMFVAVPLVLALLGGCAAPGAGDPNANGSCGEAADPVGFLMRYEWGGDMDEAELTEPSGIVYHGPRDSLFAVGDEGEILEMGRDGEPIRHRTLLEGADLEGITRDPETGLLYVAVEGDEAILEVDPEGLTIRRRFELPRQFRGRTVMAEGGEGIEAITFAPDPDHRLGGTFFVANQAFSLDEPKDTSALIEIELPIREADGSDAAEPRILAYHRIDVIDLAGLHYDRASEHFFVVCDSPNALLKISRDGRIRRGWALPGDEQEGLAIVDGEHLYIAQDVGGILRIRWTNR